MLNRSVLISMGNQKLWSYAVSPKMYKSCGTFASQTPQLWDVCLLNSKRQNAKNNIVKKIMFFYCLVVNKISSWLWMEGPLVFSHSFLHRFTKVNLYSQKVSSTLALLWSQTGVASSEAVLSSVSLVLRCVSEFRLAVGPMGVSCFIHCPALQLFIPFYLLHARRGSRKMCWNGGRLWAAAGALCGFRWPLAIFALRATRGP